MNDDPKFKAGEATAIAVIVAWLRMYTRLHVLAALIEARAHELPKRELVDYCARRGITILGDRDKR